MRSFEGQYLPSLNIDYVDINKHLKKLSRGYCRIMGYIGMCRYEGYVFQAVYSGIGHINQTVWVQDRVSFSRKRINQLKILVQVRETGNCHSQVYEMYKLKFTQLSLKATLGQGDLGNLGQCRVEKFSLTCSGAGLGFQGLSHTSPPKNSQSAPGKIITTAVLDKDENFFLIGVTIAQIIIIFLKKLCLCFLE